MMKKTIFLSFFLVSSLAIFSQVKYNKFSTKIKHAQFNPSFQFDATLIGEIDDQSGYMLSSQYDDQSGGAHPTVVKLDIDGNILFDSIYEFVPNNFSGGMQLMHTNTSLTKHVMLFVSDLHGPLGQSPAAPYIINMDMNGNINWQIGLQDDTLELVPSRIVNTQDGGYAIAGGMWDGGSSQQQKQTGFIIKLDASGNILWDSLYRDTDTLSFEFNALVETPDGGLLVAGIAPQYHNGTDTPLLLAKMNSSGSVIWSKVQKLAAPILANYGPDEINIGMINNTDAVVSYEVHNSSIIREIALTSFNTNTGVNNWTKTYSSGSEAEMSFATFDGKGNIIINAMDTTDQSVTYRFDDQGNYLGAKSFMTSLPSPANHFPLSIIPTKDGGFVHTNYIDQNDVLVVKTDDELDPSCPAVDSLYPYTLSPSTNIDTSYFGILDSTYSVPNLASVTLAGGTPFNTEADDSLICSCSNMITGNVMDGPSPVNNAHVFLFKKGVVPKPWSPIDSVHTDVTGAYLFNYVPTDSFLVKVEPDPLFNPNSMISYHKHLDTCYKWESAGVFHVHCDSGNVVKDVTLITPPPLTGGSALNGYIYENTGSFNKAPGDPIPGIEIVVEQSPGGIIGGGSSGGNGYYDLQNINSNATYIISVDYPGLPHDSIWTVNLNLNDSTLDSLNFYVDSTGIYIIDGGLTGIGIVDTDPLDFEVYPNPSNNNFNLQINAIKPEDVQLEIMNELGQTVFSKQENLNSGSNTIILNTEDYSQGLYLLKIKQKSSIYFKKIVKQ